MHGTRRSLTLLLFLLLPWPATAAPLRIVATPDVIADYQRLVGDRKPVEISTYQGEGSRRDVVELLLVRQALVLGGDARPVELVPVPTYRRMLALVADGHADLTGSTVWDSDIAQAGDRLLSSSALIPEGAFVAGIFHAANAPHAARKIQQRRWPELTAVSSRTWTPDWRALQQLGLAAVYDTAEWPAMVRMVGAGRADFLLAPFQAGHPDAAIRVDDVTLVPAGGLCVALPGSRHIAVTGSNGGPRTRQALERGLAQLQRNDAIRRAYIDAGFFPAGTRTCQPLTPH